VLSALSEPICGSVPQSHGRLVLDNGQFHKAKKLSIPKNVELTFLPPYSPELNPVERFWQYPLADWPSTSTSTHRACDKRPEWLFVVTPIERSLP
jgi:transposase